MRPLGPLGLRLENAAGADREEFDVERHQQDDGTLRQACEALGKARRADRQRQEDNEAQPEPAPATRHGHPPEIAGERCQEATRSPALPGDYAPLRPAWSIDGRQSGQSCRQRPLAAPAPRHRLAAARRFSLPVWRPAAGAMFRCRAVADVRCGTPGQSASLPSAPSSLHPAPWPGCRRTSTTERRAHAV